MRNCSHIYLTIFVQRNKNMRVIAGKYRHRILKWPEDVKHIRPTKDRIREAIFGALGNIDNCLCLDLYSGSGAMGIEALSRGAKKCVFVDINPIALNTTKENLSSLNINRLEYEIIALEDNKAIDKFYNNHYQFDLVILDPPYKKGKYLEIVNLLLEKNLLTDNAIIVCESDREIDLPFDKFNRYRKYKYGEIKVTILWR